MALTENRAYIVEGQTRPLRVRISNSKSTPKVLYRGSILAVNPETGLADTAGGSASAIPCVLTRQVEIAPGETAAVEAETGRIWLDCPAAAQANVGNFASVADDAVSFDAKGVRLGMVLDVEPGAKVLVDFGYRS